MFDFMIFRFGPPERNNPNYEFFVHVDNVLVMFFRRGDFRDVQSLNDHPSEYVTCHRRAEY